MNPIPLGPAAAPPGRTVTRAPERDAVDSPLRMPVHRRVLGRTKPEAGFDEDGKRPGTACPAALLKDTRKTGGKIFRTSRADDSILGTVRSHRQVSRRSQLGVTVTWTKS